MTLDLLEAAGGEPWRDAASFWTARTRAIVDLDAPVATLDLDALRFNALDRKSVV